MLFVAEMLVSIHLKPERASRCFAMTVEARNVRDKNNDTTFYVCK